MATKEYLHNLDLVKVAQLLNARLHNVTNAEETALAATLGADNAGLVIYNTDLDVVKTWDGTQFNAQAIEVEGDVIFRGVIAPVDFDQTPAHVVAGSEYVAGGAGTLEFPGVTFIPSAVVEAGDRILFVSETTVYTFQRNDSQATDTVLGNVRLATQPEVDAGTEGEAVVTPATLQGKLQGQYARSFVATVDVVALTPLTVAHNLALADRNSCHVSTYHGNREVSLQVDSVDANSITLTSLLSRTGIRVVVTGPQAV